MGSKNIIPIYFVCIFFGMSCANEPVALEVPPTYEFLRDGTSTVDFSGQTTRIQMAEELAAALLDPFNTENDLLEFFNNQDSQGNDVNPFESEALNNSTKSISSKIAASRDFFFTNTTETAAINNLFENWISSQVTEVFSNKDFLAAPGIPGQIADGTSVRYVSAKGLEYNQAILKSLIGGMMVDQILNHYLSPAVLDEGNNRVNLEALIVEEGKMYTTMEHKWDEAYGYLFGLSSNVTEPLSSLGSDDSFLNKYLGKVDEDSDFTGIAQEIFDAFKKGRAAIVANEYEVRDKQADIIKDLVSKVIAVRAVHYLQQGKVAIPNDPNSLFYGKAFHELSEAYGFVFSLQFTRRSGSQDAYFSKAEVNGFLEKLISENSNGYWEISPEVLDEISGKIAERFDFSVNQAAE